MRRFAEKQPAELTALPRKFIRLFCQCSDSQGKCISRRSDDFKGKYSISIKRSFSFDERREPLHLFSTSGIENFFCSKIVSSWNTKPRGVSCVRITDRLSRRNLELECLFSRTRGYMHIRARSTQQRAFCSRMHVSLCATCLDGNKHRDV